MHEYTHMECMNIEGPSCMIAHTCMHSAFCLAHDSQSRLNTAQLTAPSDKQTLIVAAVRVWPSHCRARQTCSARPPLVRDRHALRSLDLWLQEPPYPLHCSDRVVVVLVGLFHLREVDSVLADAAMGPATKFVFAISRHQTLSVQLL